MAASALTEKQEAFALAYVETGCASTAYRRAYNAENMKEGTLHPAASRLLKHCKVSARVEQLRAEHRQRHDITVDGLTEMLIADRELARKTEAPAAAVSAVMALAKLHGLIVDKSKSDINLDVMVTARDEADAFTRGIAGLASRLGAGREAGDTEH